jgi:hypothetical protein
MKMLWKPRHILSLNMVCKVFMFSFDKDSINVTYMVYDGWRMTME